MDSEIILDHRKLATHVEPGRTHAWIVAGPKSGSTWLTELLTILLGWPTNNLVSQHGRNEQEIDFRRMVPHLRGNLLSRHQHCRYSEITEEFIKHFGVRVIVQGRDLFDSLISFRDHLDKETVVVPAAFVPPAYLLLSPEDRLDFVVRVVAPSFFTFYGSWFDARARGACEFCWVTYEELLANPPATVKRLLAFLGQPRQDEDIARALEAVATVNTRKNVAVVGRGYKEFSVADRQEIRRLARFYPGIDFSPIGL